MVVCLLGLDSGKLFSSVKVTALALFPPNRNSFAFRGFAILPFGIYSKEILFLLIHKIFKLTFHLTTNTTIICIDIYKLQKSFPISKLFLKAYWISDKIIFNRNPGWFS